MNDVSDECRIGTRGVALLREPNSGSARHATALSLPGPSICNDADSTILAHPNGILIDRLVLGALPALKKPTISELSDSEWVALNTIVEEEVVRQLIPRLKAARAQDIVEYPLNKIVL